MKIGDIIECSDKDDVRDMLKDLGEAGYGAVRMAPYSSYFIRITSEPEKAGKQGE